MILLACEESQIVTKELRALGKEAYSCDILPTSGDHPEWHIQQDIKDVLYDDWDMIIAFPPCTHICCASASTRAAKRADGRFQEGVDFFMLFTDLKCERVAIENPIGLMSTLYRKPDQYIQPYEYGDEATKKTCLWLKNLPHLVPTNIVDKGARSFYKNSASQATWSANMPKENRGMMRSKTFPGIAKAMAQQWGSLV